MNSETTWKLLHGAPTIMYRIVGPGRGCEKLGDHYALEATNRRLHTFLGEAHREKAGQELPDINSSWVSMI
ncbi:AAEL011207-PA [Aedes aegypti]|uniref:AAEL011207-PA n=1 Tax=Aedes aegypti TaxID=7159 RepID=Q16QQ9_AEDAE|nr:AAEL011207-PA [Aedes aegypti]